MSNTFAIVDDQDPRIQYHGNWSNILNYQSALGDSLSVAAAAGAYASFTFDGTAIGVWGYLEPGPPVLSTYSIDGKNQTAFVGPSNVTQEEVDVNFFAVSNLSEGNHTLLITATNATIKSVFVIDYLAFVPSSSAAAGSSASYLTTSLPSSTSPVVIIAKSSSKTNVGAIVGGVVGGVACLVVAALAIFFLYFKRRGRGKAYFYQPADPSDMLTHEMKPSPCIEGSMPAGSTVVASAYAGPGSFGSHSQSTALSPPVSEVDSPGAAHSLSYIGGAPSYQSPPASGIPHGASPNQPHSKAVEAGLLSVARPTAYHADSGMRFSADGGASGSSAHVPEDIPLDVPPEYSES